MVQTPDVHDHSQKFEMQQREEESCLEMRSQENSMHRSGLLLKTVENNFSIR